MVAETVRRFIEMHLHQPARIIVGLSGGADSMALLLALKASGVSCIAAHCNFHLRGSESDRDRAHCEETCRRLGIELLIKDFDVEKRRHKTGESLEMACRSLRYDWWDSLIKNDVADFVAVGHHREDNVETLFLNLMRGCGIAGAKGMMPVNGYIIRPMLSLSRQEIKTYVRKCGFEWVTDHTNLENDFSRNKLRNLVMPELESAFPGAIQSISRSMALLRENYELFESLVDDKRALYTSPSGDVDVRSIMENEKHGRELLHQMLSKTGLNHSQIADIATAYSQSGRRFETLQGEYVLDRGILTHLNDACSFNEVSTCLPSLFEREVITVDEFRKEISDGVRRPDRLYIDAKALDGNPEWTVRSWRQGDRMQPFGMKGTRLVSDIFNDLKIGASKKNYIPLLFRDDKLIWIAGVRASNLYRVTENTEKVIKLVYRYGDKG